MKIVIISQLFLPKWIAGSEIAAYYIAKNLAEKGNDVHVITSWDPGLEETSSKDGFFIHRCKCKKIRILSFFIFTINSIILVIKLNPDIVHSQGIYTGLPGIFSKFFMKKTCIVWTQGCDAYYASNHLKIIKIFILNHTHQLIALTNDMKSKIEKFVKKEVIILPNGVDLSRFGNRKSIANRNHIRLIPNQWLLLFVGTLIPVKGLSYLIQAIYILVSKGYENINLILVGDGEDRQYLKELTEKLNLSQNVNFVGQVPNDNIPYYMMCSDIFVLPSISEGLPLVILEAMASGLPIITTNVRGLPEIVIDRENGLLVDSKSTNDLADKILEMIYDDELRGKIGKNNLEKSLSYSWDTITDELYNIYLSNIILGPQSRK